LTIKNQTGLQKKWAKKTKAVRKLRVQLEQIQLGSVVGALLSLLLNDRG
jgi:hypothetical protein